MGDNKLDLSLDDIIAKEGIASKITAFNASKGGIKREIKTNQSANIVVKVANESSDPTKIDQSLADVIASSDDAVAANGSKSHGYHFGPNCGQIFVENLSSEVKDDEMRQLFELYGSVQRVAVNYEKTGRSSGTAFVVFDRKADAIVAFNTYQNITLDGRPLRLTLVDGNSSGGHQRAGNLNSRLKSGPKPVFKASGRDLWNNLAKDYDSSPAEEQGFNRNKRSHNFYEKKEKVMLTTDELDTDLDDYLAQRNK